MHPLTLDPSLAWWIGAVEIPLACALAAWLVRRQRALSDAVAAARERFSASDRERSEELMRFRLEAARAFATTASLREAEARLTRRLQRMESKLDSLLFAPPPPRAAAPPA